MNLRPMTVESYLKDSSETKEISATTLKVKLHSYYTKTFQPVNYEKISSVINELVEQGVMCKKGDKYILS